MDDGNHDEGSSYFPSFRVWLCGTFRMERRVGSGYELVRTTEWGGSSYPRLLLKALLCCPGRQARREALLEMLWPDAEPEQAAQCLNTATTKLRKVLVPGKGEASLLLTDEDSRIYRLAEQSLLWVDVDAALTLLGEAERRGRMSPEALSLLEEAETYVSKGMILQEEEGQWAAGRRANVEQARYRTRLWLAEAYAQQQMPGQATTVLSHLLEEDQTDEDVLARLMLLLHRQGMTRQALRVYERSCEVAAREEVELTEATRKLVAQLVKSERTYPSDALTSPSTPILLSRQQHDSPSELANAITQGIIEAARELEGALPVNLSEPIDRRTVLTRLLGLSPTLLALDRHSSSSFADVVSVLEEDPSAFIDEKTLMTFEKVTENSWLLLRYDGLLTVEQLLPIYLQRFALFAHKSSPYQERIASIVAQGYMLQGLVAVLNSDATGSEKFCEQAVFYARLAKDRNLEAAALKHLATKFLDNGHPLWTLQTFQEILSFVQDISPLLRGRTYLGLAVAYARLHQESDALYYLDLAHDSFPENPESDASFSYADCHTSSLYHYGGLIHTEFARFEKARDSFVQVEELPTRSTIPERTRIEIINCQTEASLALRDVRSSRDLIEKSITGALKLKSDKRYHDALALYKQARLLWPQDRQMNDLADLFIR